MNQNIGLEKNNQQAYLMCYYFEYIFLSPIVDIVILVLVPVLLILAALIFCNFECFLGQQAELLFLFTCYK